MTSAICPVCERVDPAGGLRIFERKGEMHVACADEHACADAWSRLPSTIERARLRRPRRV